MPTHETAPPIDTPPGAHEAAPAAVPAPRPSFTRHHVLGMACLLLTVVPAYLASRPADPTTGGGAAAVAGEEDDTNGRAVDPLELDAHIRAVADRYGVSPRLVAAIIEAESEFNPRAVSRKGARGLMQLMPATATSLAVEDSFDPYANIEGGVRHLRRLMDRFHGNLPLVLAAYNAGERTVVAYRGVPPYRETRRYVKRIMRRLNHPSVVRPPRAPAGGPETRAGLASAATARISVADILRSASAWPRLAAPGPGAARVSAADVLRDERVAAHRPSPVRAPTTGRRGSEGP